MCRVFGFRSVVIFAKIPMHTPIYSFMYNVLYVVFFIHHNPYTIYLSKAISIHFCETRARGNEVQGGSMDD
jgi:hypothetical protein